MAAIYILYIGKLAEKRLNLGCHKNVQQLVTCLNLVLYFSQVGIWSFRWRCAFSKLRRLFALLPMRLWGELVCEILKLPVFVGRVFFILIRNLDLQKSVCCIKQKGINRLYGALNALWGTELKIVLTVHFWTKKKNTHFINGARLEAAQLKIPLKREGGLFNLAKRINGSKVSRGRTCGSVGLYCFF